MFVYIAHVHTLASILYSPAALVGCNICPHTIFVRTTTTQTQTQTQTQHKHKHNTNTTQTRYVEADIHLITHTLVCQELLCSALHEMLHPLIVSALAWTVSLTCSTKPATQYTNWHLLPYIYILLLATILYT